MHKLHPKNIHKSLSSTQVIAWRVLQNSITTKDNLLRRRVILISSLCELCGEEEETINHLFFKCKVTLIIWGFVFVLAKLFVGESL